MANGAYSVIGNDVPQEMADLQGNLSSASQSMMDFRLEIYMLVHYSTAFIFPLVCYL